MIILPPAMWETTFARNRHAGLGRPVYEPNILTSILACSRNVRSLSCCYMARRPSFVFKSLGFFYGLQWFCNHLIKMFKRHEECIAHEWIGQKNRLNSCERHLIGDKTFPSSYEDDSPDVRIVAVGDLHGDWLCLLRILELSRMFTMIKDGDNVVECHWNGGLHDYLVVCGDCVDMKRGDDPVAEVAHAEWRMLILLSQLCDESDGHVIRLVGNHEIMLLEGVETFRTANSIHNDQLRGDGDWRRLWLQTDGMYRKLVGSCGGYRAVVRINRWIFCHGGVPYQLVRQLKDELNLEGDRTLEYINQFYHRMVSENLSSDNMRARHGISDTLYQSLLQILWTRVYASPSIDMRSPCEEYTQMIDRLYPGNSAHYRLVVAHCIQPSNGLLRNSQVPTVSIRTMIPRRIEHVSMRVTSSIYDTQTQTCIYPLSLNVEPECPLYVGINGDCASADSAHVPRVYRIDCAMSHAFDALFDETREMRYAREPQILVVQIENGAEQVSVHRFRN